LNVCIGRTRQQSGYCYTYQGFAQADFVRLRSGLPLLKTTLIIETIPRRNETPDLSGAISQSGRGRMGSCLGVRIAATGSYVPDLIVTNEDLASLGCDSDWIVQRTGIRERRVASPDQATSDLAYEAILRCLRQSGVNARDVDLLICATMTPDFATPSTACLLQQRLGCIAPAFDVNAACAGFMVALITAAQYVRTGLAKNAIVVGSEVMSRTVDRTDIKTYPLFGDGAGAVLLQPSATADGESGILSFTLGSEGNAEALCIPGGGSREPISQSMLDQSRQFLKMDGRSVFVWAVRVVEDSIRDVLAAANVKPSEISAIILHQANIRIIDAAIKSLDVPKDRVFVNLDRYGNTSAASIPLVLDDAYQQGAIHKGDLVLLCGFGAGLTWGTSLIRW
jgi:3-oxoacyl-[acyl-carrier-protein] synthase-3